MENKDGTVTIDISGITSIDTEDLYIDNSMVSTITLTSSPDTLSDYVFNTASTISDDTITVPIDDTHWADGIVWEQTEFKDAMPNLEKVEKMCIHYPALAKAYENFKTIYKMVDQDYKGNYEDNDE